jgi:hypothetical protein
MTADGGLPPPPHLGGELEEASIVADEASKKSSRAQNIVLDCPRLD